MPEVPKGCNGLMAASCTGIVLNDFSYLNFHLSKHPPEQKIHITEDKLYMYIYYYIVSRKHAPYTTANTCTCKTREQQSTKKAYLSDTLNLMLSFGKMLTDIHVQYKSHKVLLYKTMKQDGMYNYCKVYVAIICKSHTCT